MFHKCYNKSGGDKMFHVMLKELRISRHISQQELADLLGYSRAAISGYEIGRNQPSYEDLKRIAIFFNVTIDYLLGHTLKGEPSFVPSVKLVPEEERLIEIYQSINVKGKKKLLEEAKDILDHPKYTEIVEERRRHA